MSILAAWWVYSLGSLVLTTLNLPILIRRISSTYKLLMLRTASWAALSSVWFWIECCSITICCSDPTFTAGLCRWIILTPCIRVWAGARLILLINYPSCSPSVLHGREGCPGLISYVTLILPETHLVVVLGHELNILEAAIFPIRPLLRGNDCNWLITASECNIISHVCCTACHIID